MLGADGALLNRDFARGELAAALQPGEAADVTVRLPALQEGGRYGLKFDLVYEGVDWFERCGSPPTVRPLWVA